MTEYELFTEDQTIPNNDDHRITDNCKVIVEVCIQMTSEFLTVNFMNVYSLSYVHHPLIRYKSKN